MRQKEHHHPGFEPRTPRSEAKQRTCSSTQVLHNNLSDWYVSTFRYEYTFRKNWQWNENSTRRRESARARSMPLLAGPGGASKARHVEQSAHREVDLIRSRTFTVQKPGRNMTSRLLGRHGQQYPPYIFTKQMKESINKNKKYIKRKKIAPTSTKSHSKQPQRFAVRLA